MMTTLAMPAKNSAKETMTPSGQRFFPGFINQLRGPIKAVFTVWSNLPSE